MFSICSSDLRGLTSKPSSWFFTDFVWGKNNSVFANTYLLGLALLLTYVQSIYFNRSQQLGARTSNLMTQEIQNLAKANDDFLTVTGMLKQDLSEIIIYCSCSTE